MAFNPTKAQTQAIDTKGNILVSAAAGSGKTAVLVERVIKKLCNKENPTRADELLIVTFTNAAAAEMRSRIEKRLDEECQNNPFDTGLLLQKNLINSAKICTIDSFCIDLVRENFDKLGISPDFKIGEESDLKAINQEVIYSIINRYFNQNNQLFLQLLDVIGGEFDEQNFIELVLSIYEYSRQLPFPKKWYAEILHNYNNGVFDSNNLWYKYAFEKAQHITASMLKSIETAINHLTDVEKAYNAYNKVFLEAKEQISDLNTSALTNDWDTFYNTLNTFKLAKLPSPRGLGGFSQIVAAKKTYKYLNGDALSPLYKLFYNDFNFINNQFKKLYPVIELFVDILIEFDDKVFEAYKNENIFTFHNTEHLALQLLCKEENGKILVSENATDLLNQFSEVMVDEYQDTNDLQDRLFYILSNYDKKLFVVGDVKQSIYAFRGANPTNFLRKKQSYLPLERAKNNMAQKIILGNNFRSKDEVCRFVNYFFEIFMQSETGNIIYDGEEKLIPTAEFPESDDTAVSFDIIDTTNSNESALTLEARSIAKFIKDTISGKECIKEDKDVLRKANYGDFTILLRSVKNKMPILVGELEKQGIPVNISINNFADSIEINALLSLLRVIDNPKNDIALATVMLSPIFGFTADELAQIRIDSKYSDLYQAVITASKNGNEHTSDLLNKLEKYRLKSVTTPLPKLILSLLIETEFLNIVSSLPDGEQRRNNLLYLCELSNGYISNKSHSISAFCDYVQKFSSAGAGSSDNNAVKVMSIHASKGLQFPVCIVASTATDFNFNESRKAAAYSTKYGLGFKYYDEDDAQKYTTLSREVVLDDGKTSALEEELRLLYVAMTRAQDKLHFVSSFNKLEEKLEDYKTLLLSSECKIDKTLFSQTKSYADWLMISLLLHPQRDELLENGDGIFSAITDSIVDINIIDAATLLESVSEKDQNSATVNTEFVDAIRQNFSAKYPYEELLGIQSKISVSVLANKAESEKYAFSSKPSFMSKDGVTATGRGTAMHKVMEFFDFSKAEQIEEEIDRLYEWQFISEAERDSLDRKALTAFFESPVFKRIKNAERVEREMRFLTEIPARALKTDIDKALSDEKIVVQGAVDICFIENGEVVILDFKTDRVGDIYELAESYGEQLNAYAKACEKIFGMKVKEKIIYSFTKSNIVYIK